MAVEASAKPTMVIDYDIDEGPVVFKRSNPTSKQNQLNLEVKKPNITEAGWTFRNIYTKPVKLKSKETNIIDAGWTFRKVDL